LHGAGRSARVVAAAGRTVPIEWSAVLPPSPIDGTTATAAAVASCVVTTAAAPATVGPTCTVPIESFAEFPAAGRSAAAGATPTASAPAATDAANARACCI